MANHDAVSRVLFVCLGNICRSPAAEGVLTQLVEEKNLSNQIEVDSAGTGAWHVGERADPRMRRAATKRGLELTSRSRQIVPGDFDRFDLVVAMDRSNLRDLQSLAGGPRAHIRLLSEFLDDVDQVDVPDPYYGGVDGFDTVLDMLEAAAPRILEHLNHEHRAG